MTKIFSIVFLAIALETALPAMNNVGSISKKTIATSTTAPSFYPPLPPIVKLRAYPPLPPIVK